MASKSSKGIVAFIAYLDAAFEKNMVHLDAKLKFEIEAHLQLLEQEFERYFTDLTNTDLPESKLPRNVFHAEMGLLPNKIQKQFLEFKCYSVTKDDFETRPLNDFWAKYVQAYRNIGNVAMRIPLPFSATYCTVYG